VAELVVHPCSEPKVTSSNPGMAHTNVSLVEFKFKSDGYSIWISQHPKSGLVRFSNDLFLSGCRMVRFSNGPQA
jgi:hypothetical protein